jgi:O-antigen/teichoic acid export membrane protein
VQTLITYGLAQGALALSAFIKVPLIVGSGGNEAYAAVTLILSGWAVFAALADGLSQTSRVMLAERGAAHSQRVRRLVGGAASGEAVVAVIVAIGGLAVLSVSGGPIDLWLLLFGFAIACLPMAYAKGILEASNRTALSNATLVTNVVVSLPLVVLAAYLSGDRFWLCAATLAGVAAPYLVFAILSHEPGLRTIYAPSTTRQVVKSVAAATVYSFANVMAYAFDPIIVAALLTTADVSAFGLASRIMTLAMLLPLALGGLVSARVNTWRGELESSALLRRVLNLCLVLGGVGTIVSTLAVAVGPVLGRWLGRGVIETPFTLYLSLGVFAIISSATGPIFALFSGPGAVRFRAVVALVAGTANLGLSVVLVPYFGVSGPVVASIVCLIGMVLALVLRVRREMDSILVVHD